MLIDPLCPMLCPNTVLRPKLLWGSPADPFRPTHLTNGASPVWQAAVNASDPCAICRACVMCKVTSVARGYAEDLDWTYTLVRPIR